MRPGCCPWMGVGGRAGALLPPAGVECLGCGRAEPAPTFRELPGSSCSHLPHGTFGIAAAVVPWAGSSRGSRVGCHGPARGPLRDLGWEVKSSRWAVLLEWCSGVSPAPKTGWAREEQRKNQELSASIHGKLSKAR